MVDAGCPANTTAILCKRPLRNTARRTLANTPPVDLDGESRHWTAIQVSRSGWHGCRLLQSSSRLLLIGCSIYVSARHLGSDRHSDAMADGVESGRQYFAQSFYRDRPLAHRRGNLSSLP